MLSYDELKNNVKAGDVLYECEYGSSIPIEMTSKPKEHIGGGIDERNTLTWTGKNLDNDQHVDFMVTEGLTNYGPQLYWRPVY